MCSASYTLDRMRSASFSNCFLNISSPFFSYSSICLRFSGGSLLNESPLITPNSAAGSKPSSSRSSIDCLGAGFTYSISCGSGVMPKYTPTITNAAARAMRNVVNEPRTFFNFFRADRISITDWYLSSGNSDVAFFTSLRYSIGMSLVEYSHSINLPIEYTSLRSSTPPPDSTSGARYSVMSRYKDFWSLIFK